MRKRDWGVWGAAALAMAAGRVLAQAPTLPTAADSTVVGVALPSASVSAEAASGLQYGEPAAVVPERALRRFGAANLTPALSRVPGVRLETRAPGSYRVVIRGTSRRSPFGVRDVRVYWNDLMLTEPGGDTPLNFVDVANVDEVAVGKGPHATAAGNPLGGALYLRTAPTSGATAHAQVGSFGQVAGGGAVGFGVSPDGGPRGEVRLHHRQADNYRAHSALARSTAQVSRYREPATADPERWSLTTATHVLATRLDYELPGALTPERYAEDPRLARPGSAEAAAAIDYENVLVGTALRLERGAWALALTPQLSGFRFDNPFNVNHKRETNVGLGGRASAKTVLRGAAAVTAGGEFQTDFRSARQYDPNGGSPGELQYVDDVTTRRIMAFAELDGALGGGRWRYGLGASLTDLGYAVRRTYERDGAPGSAGSDFAPSFAPRASLAYAADGGLDLGVMVARGTSAPTLREFRTNEGSLNTDLRPERGTTAELRAAYAPRDGLDLRANAYYTRLSETITTFQDASDVQLFRNSGSANQPGLELAAVWRFLSRERASTRGTHLTLAPSYAYQPYRYREYEVDGESFAGRPMPGLPEHTLDVLLSAERFWRTPTGEGGFRQNTLSADLNVRHESATPLDDGGTVEAEAFAVVRLQVAYDLGGRLREDRRRGFTLCAGVDNLTDVTYSLGNDINPQFGNRYFQPAPGRNWFVRGAVRF